MGELEQWKTEMSLKITNSLEEIFENSPQILEKLNI